MFGIVGLPVPDETLLILLGYLVLKGDLQFVLTFMTALAGVFCGITISYFLGRTGGTFMVKRYGVLLHVTDAHLLLVRQWFDRIGKWSLMIGYFFPGLRHVIAIVAGASGLRLSSFMIFAYSGAFIWAAVFITSGYVIGKEWHQWSKTMHGLLLMAVMTVILMGAGYVIYRKWLNLKPHD
jgi:membrane protein DedA with SNARE-associated domain